MIPNLRRLLVRTPFLAPLLIAASTAPAQESQTTNSFAVAQKRFGLNLLTVLQKKATGYSNLFVSPVSISSALAMAWSGADGTTKTALGQTLHLNGQSVGAAGKAYAALRSTLLNPENPFRLQIANALWVDKSVALAPPFVSLCRTDYGAEATALPMATAPADAARTINQWTSRNTQGKIPTIIGAGDLHSASAVLTNAVYFKATWQSKFEKTATKPAPFYVAGGLTDEAIMMHQRSANTFGYWKGNGFAAARLPYQSAGGADVAMYIFLPDKGQSVAATLAKVAAQPWAATTAKFKTTSLILSVPRFKTEYSTELTPPLTALGAGIAFTNFANFTPMGLNRHRISKVLHKTFIAVDEEGTEAAAATAILISPTAMRRPTPPVVFNADHPFLYLIADDATGTILFAGVLNRPLK